jgi:hypothetical protein
MSERKREASDEEIDTRSVLSFGIGLALTMIVVLWIVWLLLAHWKEREIGQDRPPSPMAEARAPRLPPGPNLQSAPVRDMEELRAREDAILSSYGWVDRQAGIGRIPIDRAVDLLLEEGLQAPASSEAPPEQKPRRPDRRVAAPASPGGKP